MSQANQTPVASSKLREIIDLPSWVSCFLAFLAVRVDNKETRELEEYCSIVIHLAWKRSRRGWISYDRLFRQQKGAGTQML